MFTLIQKERKKNRGKKRKESERKVKQRKKKERKARGGNKNRGKPRKGKKETKSNLVIGRRYLALVMELLQCADEVGGFEVFFDADGFEKRRHFPQLQWQLIEERRAVGGEF